MRKIKKLLDEYRFPGFRPRAAVKGRFGDNKARIIEMIRRLKKLFAGVAELSMKSANTQSARLRRNRIGEFGIGKFTALAASSRFEVETKHGDFHAHLPFNRNC